MSLTKHIEKEISEYYRLSETTTVPHVAGEWRWTPNKTGGVLSDIEILGTDGTPYEDIWLGMKLEIMINETGSYIMPYFVPCIVHSNVSTYDGSVCIEMSSVDPERFSVIPCLEEIRYLLTNPAYDDPMTECESFYNSDMLRDWALRYREPGAPSAESLIELCSGSEDAENIDN